MSNHADEMIQFYHVIQLIIGRELTGAERKKIDTWIWNYKDRQCADYESQLQECLRLDMPRRRGWVRYERFEPSEKMTIKNAEIT